MKFNTNKKEWVKWSDEYKDQYVNFVFNELRKNGFPYYETSEEYRDEEFYSFINFNQDHLYIDNKIKQTMHGLSLAWSYMPHSFEVKCNDMISPLEAFNDDKMLLKAIRKRMSFGDNMSLAAIRKILRIMSGVQGVSNFRPTAACAIYDKWCPFMGSVYDMSCGYGGRLLGAIKSRKVIEYVGAEPDTKTYKGLTNLHADYSYKRVKLINDGSENIILNRKFDLCFTSPPYFNTEKYSYEPTQSWIKFKTKEDWFSGFLFKTLLNCKEMMHDKSFLIINIANVKSYKNLEDDFLNCAFHAGFRLIQKDMLLLSNLNKSGFKHEPVFILKLS